MHNKIEMSTGEILSLDELRDSRLELLPDRIELHRRHRNGRRRNRHFFDHNDDRDVVVGGGDSGGGDDF